MTLGFLIWVGLLSTAFGGDPAVTPDEEPSVLVEQAENKRLSEEMHKLANRNIWTGVERHYRQMVAQGEVLSFRDYMAGAHAAQALGDVNELKSRLRLAQQMNYRSEEVRTWLKRVEVDYGEVRIFADTGQGHLEAVTPPFQPDLRAAIEFASQQLLETGSYSGLLPAGEYRLVIGRRKKRPAEFKVKPLVTTIYIDRRTKLPEP